MTTPAQWIQGARPRTLPAAVAPVLVGSAAAAAIEAFSAPLAALALVVSLALQVAVNYANDYSDGIRGTDDDRVGPLRLTASGLASPSAVRAAAFASFGVAAVAGLVLVALSQTWWLLGVGVAAIAAGWYYTGGSSPYGYSGLGEVSVFLFFGVVAVLGTQYTQAGQISASGIAGSIGIGALACALLVVNNLRDIPTDTVAGKRTLAVRLGDRGTRWFYALLLALPAVMVLPMMYRQPLAAAGLLAAPLAIAPLRVVLSQATGPALIPVLRDTARLELVYAVLISLALVLG